VQAARFQETPQITSFGVRRLPLIEIPTPGLLARPFPPATGLGNPATGYVVFPQGPLSGIDQATVGLNSYAHSAFPKAPANSEHAELSPQSDSGRSLLFTVNLRERSDDRVQHELNLSRDRRQLKPDPSLATGRQDAFDA
jgi:hypothetical protein